MKNCVLKTLKEITLLVTDGKHGDCTNEEDSGYFFLSSKDLRGGKLLYENARQITHDDFIETHRRTDLQPGDILLTNCGASIGRVGIAQNDPRILKTTFQKSISVIKPNTALIENRFLYYFLLSNSDLLIRLGDGTAQPNLLIRDLKRIEVPLPDLATQRKIAGVLSAYDELVENNQQRVLILEKIARTLYRESLATYHLGIKTVSVMNTPFWKLISENVSPYDGTKRYLATADIEGLAVCGQGINYAFAEKPSRAQKQPKAFSVWFARMKDAFKVAWYSDVNQDLAEGSVLSSGFAGFETIEPIFFPFLFLTISSREFHVQKDLFCTGATQMSLTNEGLARIQILVPPENSVRQLGARTQALLNQILVLQKECDVLRRTRDLLLPRLLSGQMALKSA